MKDGDILSTKKRLPRDLTQDEVFKLTSLEPDDLTKEKMMELFANFEDQEAQYIPQDRFILNKDIVNKYAKETIQKEDIHTTVGRYIVNLFLIFSNPKIIKKVNYINYPMDDGKIGDLGNTLASMVLTKDLEVEEFYDYLNRLHWLGFANSAYISPSLNYDILKPLPAVEKRKKELFKEHEEELANNNVEVSAQIESELIDLAKKELEGNPAKDLYDSGAKVNFGNQYKNMNIMGGAYLNNTTGGYRIIKNSLIDGIDKEDIAANGDSLVSGVYSRAVGTVFLTLISV